MSASATTVRKPCPTCPWRLKKTASDIPNFDLELAEALADTCGTPGQEVDAAGRRFACHQSKPGEEIPCAGWLAAVGYHHIGVRVDVALGRIPAEAVVPDDDWPELHPSFDEMIEKLRATA